MDPESPSNRGLYELDVASSSCSVFVTPTTTPVLLASSSIACSPLRKIVKGSLSSWDSGFAKGCAVGDGDGASTRLQTVEAKSSKCSMTAFS